VKEIQTLIEYPWLFKEYAKEPTCEKNGIPVRYIHYCDCKNCLKHSTGSTK
jgi:hypothetical protein